jgi:hypothetical protein
MRMKARAPALTRGGSVSAARAHFARAVEK